MGRRPQNALSFRPDETVLKWLSQVQTPVTSFETDAAPPPIPRRSSKRKVVASAWVENHPPPIPKRSPLRGMKKSTITTVEKRTKILHDWMDHLVTRYKHVGREGQRA
jgi:hypothetical protein